MKISIISFSNQGDLLAEQIKAGLCAEQVVIAKGFGTEKVPVKTWVKKQFEESDAMIFVGAMGICVRMIAPFIQSKVTDPCVVVLDEKGSFCISVLSGHIGGGNDFTNRIAQLVQATPVITTATDVNDIFAIDSFATKKGYKIKNTHCIKNISAKLLKGEDVYIYSDFPVENVPKNIQVTVREGMLDRLYDAYITYQSIANQDALIVVVQALTVGVGCRKDKESSIVNSFFEEVLQEANMDIDAVAKVGSIDIKSEEVAIWDIVTRCKASVEFFTKEVLNEQTGTVSSSEFVLKTVGTDCVCERSAVALGGALVVPKKSYDGVTIAVGLVEKKIDFR
ncbi:MAG: cobalamin biosynthesis protein [Lachnospiraceae bacterium]